MLLPQTAILPPGAGSALRRWSRAGPQVGMDVDHRESHRDFNFRNVLRPRRDTHKQTNTQ